MTHDDKLGIPHVRFGPINWLSNPLRTRIEEAVSDYRGCKWKIGAERDLSEFACHQCAIVSDGLSAVFFKYSEAVDAERQFEVELSGLQTLSQRAEVSIPQPIGVVQAESGTLLIMEALEAIERRPRQWREIGITLARIHQVKGDSCGFEMDGFCGPLYQDNTPTQDWVAFYRERRLLPRLKVAIDSGNIPSSMIAQVEKVATRLPELCSAEITPTLLHGDAQQNNFISTAEGTFVIDPAVYYGDPETDLALLDCFQPVPDAVFDGYRDVMPIDSGFSERRNLWRVSMYLAAVAIEGKAYLNKLTDALQRYV